ncbi:MAG: hypothetical protein JSR51_13740 [Proteobacteria bacterium]|nr:hypothetical protein [Pseudomonadota bacterium]
MNTQTYLRISVILLSVNFLYGCALIDKHLFNPAASHARIDPLFRTNNCARYVAEDGRHWLKSLLSVGEVNNFSTRNSSSLFIKESCEHQARSINDVPLRAADGTEKLTDGDRLYFKYCEPTPSDKGETKEAGKAQSLAENKEACFSYLISKSDEICDYHKSHIYGDRTAMNTVLGALALGTGVAGTMTGTTITQYLAGSAGFITGGQALMNNEIYRNFVTNAILKEIDANRAKFLADVNNSKSSALSDFGTIRSLALQYHHKCSFYDGLASLLNKAGENNILTNPTVQYLANQKKLKQEEKNKLTAEIEALNKATPKDNTKINAKVAQLNTVDKDIAKLESILASLVVPESVVPSKTTSPTSSVPPAKNDTSAPSAQNGTSNQLVSSSGE